jgi:hypothetical protein
MVQIHPAVILILIQNLVFKNDRTQSVLSCERSEAILFITLLTLSLNKLLCNSGNRKPSILNPTHHPQQKYNAIAEIRKGANIP